MESHLWLDALLGVDIVRPSSAQHSCIIYRQIYCWSVAGMLPGKWFIIPHTGIYTLDQVVLSSFAATSLAVAFLISSFFSFCPQISSHYHFCGNFLGLCVITLIAGAEKVILKSVHHTVDQDCVTALR
jgi:hypothetical protein